MTVLDVYFENRTVGKIEVHSTGPTFTYDGDWLRLKGAFPISITMPLSSTPVHPSVFVPWAANLLPEGSALRRVGELLHAAPEDVVNILSEIGRDTAGALSIGKPGTTASNSFKALGGAADLERVINELPRKPFLAGEEGVSMSLAGVQTKLGVRVLDDSTIAIPTNGAASTHILKPDSRELLGSVQNEAFCLTLARLTGLKASEITTGTAGSRQFLLVTRYDRAFMQGRWRRLHQEDFCQALGKPPEAKYEKNNTGIKGPTTMDMVVLAKNTMSGADAIAIVDYLFFNTIACNTDAHAKNYSMIISSRGPTIAPLYDVLCAKIWDGITSNLAQAIDGQNRGDHIKRRHWERFAGSIGFNPTSMVRRLDEMLGRVESNMTKARSIVAAMPAGDDPLLDRVQDAIVDRIARLKSGLAEEYGKSENVSIGGQPGKAPQMREEYVSTMRKASNRTDFGKLVRRLSRDKNMKASDVCLIGFAVLGNKFKTKKAAIEALQSADAAVGRLIS
jgi:serine/threonine-protein kinase HipA